MGRMSEFGLLTPEEQAGKLKALEKAEKSGGDHLNRVPAVKAYLNRIGADPTSMFRAVITEFEGRYPKEIARVTFTKEGGVTVTGWGLSPGEIEKLSPDEEEAAKIKEGFQGHTFPKMVLADKRTVFYDLPPVLKKAKKDGQLFEFRDVEENIIMIQQRMETDVDTIWLTWTFWDDNVWRQLEPSGGYNRKGVWDPLSEEESLPIYNFEKARGKFTVFLHEGARTAREVAKLVDDYHTPKKERDEFKKHPWFSDLEGYVHLGWIGGAKRPRDTDFAALKRIGVDHVTIVADNDKVGKDAVPEISRALKGIRVDYVNFTKDDFPAGFDLADDMPEKVKAFDNYLRPATWQTKIKNIIKPERGPAKITWGLQSAFAERFRYYILGKEYVILDLERGLSWTEQGFNRLDKAYRDEEGRLRIADLLSGESSLSCDGEAYKPGLREVEATTDEGDVIVNMWREPHLKKVEGVTIDPFLDYLEHLVPVESDRFEVMRWIATLLGKPENRMHYGLLLCSDKHGTGKSTLFDILKSSLGFNNSIMVQEKHIIDDHFNEINSRKQLVFVDEIYQTKNSKAYNKLKPLVTSDTIIINGKFKSEYRLDNHAHYVLCSNNKSGGIHVETSDRRFLVPEIVEKEREKEKWDEFYRWSRNGGAYVLRLWAKGFPEWAKEALGREDASYVAPGEHAPMTAFKKRVIEDNRSAIERRLKDLSEALLEKAEADGQQYALCFLDIQTWLRRVLPESSMPSREAPVIRKVLEGGFINGVFVTNGGKFSTAKIEGSTKHYFVVTDQSLQGALGAEINAHTIRLRDLEIEEEEAF